MTEPVLNIIGVFYVVMIAFTFGHMVGWHRGRNYGEDKRRD